jgi:hypothetical protein
MVYRGEAQRKTMSYDIIGDIHGHATKLRELLDKLGYAPGPTGYSHPTRKVIFLGDFIDRGEELREHRELLFDIVIPMVKNDHALAVMGNHEFNALGFHMPRPGNDREWLRAHSEKNVQQHQAFLNEFLTEPQMLKDALGFFRSLPMWLELDGIRVVHACWHQESIDLLTSRTEEALITDDLLVEATTKGTEVFDAVEIVLKGIEQELPNGESFSDKNHVLRRKVRMQWWNATGRTFGEVALPLGVDIKTAANIPVPADRFVYGADEPPVFVGHYWMEGTPCPISRNVACVDYSAGIGGSLVAYRYDSEMDLTADKFVWAEV